MIIMIEYERKEEGNWKKERREIFQWGKRIKGIYVKLLPKKRFI